MPMTSDRTSFPARRAAAALNRARILAAARAAFAEPNAEISMAEIARRAGVGMATLYRNFPGRQELLEGLYVEEVNALCEAPASGDARTPGAAFTAWLRLVLAFVPTKRLIVSELLEHTDASNPILSNNRARVLAVGRPLLDGAQHAHEIRDDLTLEQILAMISAIAKIHGDPGYLEPMFQTMLDGLYPLAGRRPS
jgi:AcrR family transcriptional regulator